MTVAARSPSATCRCGRQRVTFVGELGWELYAPAEYGAGAVAAAVGGGAAHGLVAGGYRAIDSLRLEKGYRVWGADITPETDPGRGRAGLLRQAWTSRADSSGRDALARQRDGGPCAGGCAA